MDALGSLIRCEGRYEVSIGWGGWICVDHGEKVITHFGAIAGPDEQVVTLAGSLRIRGTDHAMDCEESNDDQDLYKCDWKARQGASPQEHQAVRTFLSKGT
jgi:hypothetical protein